MYWARGYWFTGLITGDESLIDLYLRFIWLYKEAAKLEGSFSFRNLRKAIFQRETNKLYLELKIRSFPMSFPIKRWLKLSSFHFFKRKNNELVRVNYKFINTKLPFSGFDPFLNLLRNLTTENGYNRTHIFQFKFLEILHEENSAFYALTFWLMDDPLLDKFLFSQQACSRLAELVGLMFWLIEKPIGSKR